MLDVKTGAGAFMKTAKQARQLATSLVAIGRASGVRTEAVITNMDAPLGRTVGNALEVVECLETLKGRGPEDVEALSVVLAARMLILAGIESDEAAASATLRATLRSGAGLEKLRQIVENQGGDPRALDDYSPAAVGAGSRAGVRTAVRLRRGASAPGTSAMRRSPSARGARGSTTSSTTASASKCWRRQAPRCVRESRC